MRTIGIVGSRRRDTAADRELVRQAFLKIFQPGDRICSGLCPQGADRFAVDFAVEYDTQCLWFPAKWKEHGRGAGIMRNTDIAQNSDILIACVAPDRLGGTEDTVVKFIRFHGIQNLIIVGASGLSPVVMNVNDPDFDRLDPKRRIYIGRGSPWGNPFSELPRESAIESYRQALLVNFKMLAKLRSLWGLALGCHCKPLDCHGDVLVELAARV